MLALLILIVFLCVWSLRLRGCLKRGEKTRTCFSMSYTPATHARFQPACGALVGKARAPRHGLMAGGMWETSNTMLCRAKGKLSSLTALSTRYHHTIVFGFLKHTQSRCAWSASPNQENPADVRGCRRESGKTT